MLPLCQRQTEWSKTEEVPDYFLFWINLFQWKLGNFETKES